MTTIIYTNDALTLTTTNKVTNATAESADVVARRKKSETVYTGNEGEEKARTTYNFNFDGDAIKTVTTMTYTNDALTLTTTNKVIERHRRPHRRNPGRQEERDRLFR